jgi:alpha-L-rhamnosidase
VFAADADAATAAATAASPAQPVWIPAVAPSVGPASFGSRLSAHHADNIIQTHQSFDPTNITQPKPGSWVFDFSQNMAGQVTLRVPNCPAGTIISMQHAEILYPNGLVHDSFCERRKYWLCNLRQMANYTCSGAEPLETYRVAFVSMGFRYVQLVGFPGVPTEESLTAHFIRSAVPQTGECSV